MTKNLSGVVISEDNPVVKIETLYPNKNNVMYINWFFGKRCQFDCSYCPDVWHDTTSVDHSLSTLKFAWHKIQKELALYPDIKFYITYSGGEPTISDAFLPFNKWLRDEFGDKILYLQYTTNGTRQLEYYVETANIFNQITFSIHSEFSNEKKLFTNITETDKYVKNVKPFGNSFINVHFMHEPWHAERQAEYVKFFEEQQIRYRIIPTADWGENKTARPIRIHKSPFNFDDYRNKFPKN